jgi:hypothetical protein
MPGSENEYGTALPCTRHIPLAGEQSELAHAVDKWTACTARYFPRDIGPAVHSVQMHRLRHALERLGAERLQHERVANPRLQLLGDHDRVGTRERLDAGRQVDCVAKHVGLTSLRGTDLGHDHEAVVDAHACGDLHSVRSAGAVQICDRTLDLEGGRDGVLRGSLPCFWIAEEREKAVPDVVGHEPVAPPDGPSAQAVVGVDDLAERLGVEACRHRRRVG